ncbi:MAG: trypsin-like peptidase domain-containing protein [Pirellulaceae bacterium]
MTNLRWIVVLLATWALPLTAEEPAPALFRGTLLAPKAFRVAAAKVQPALVRIDGFGGIAAGVDGGGYQGPGEGPTTGLVISSDGYIVTSTYNFLRMPPIITVIAGDGRRHVAKLLGRDETRRICLLKVDGVSDWPVPDFVARDQLQVGQWVVATGFGYGASQPALSAGIISATSRISGRAVQTDANLSPANYGGPLVDLDGRVVGICVPLSPQGKNAAAGAEWYDSGIGFAVPLAEIDSVLAAMKAGKTLQPGFLGVQVQASGDPPTGAVIEKVVPDSPAARAGLLADDRFVSVGGIEIQDATHLATVVGRFLAGEKVEVVVQRGEERKTVEVVLAVAPPAPQPMPMPVPMPGVPPRPPRPPDEPAN